MTLPGTIRQIGYVVTDLDSSLAGWVELGVGPWFVIRSKPQRVLYRGEPCETTLSLAFANSGDMQFEVIQQQDATPSIFTEFLSSGREGFHQFAYWTEDFGATMQAVEEVGWPVVWSGGEDVGTRFAYVEPANSPATVIEIMELTEATRVWRRSSATPRRVGTAATPSATLAGSPAPREWPVMLPIKRFCV